VAACTIPPRLATLETADVLGEHEHEVEVGGGGGAWNLNDSIGGGAARVRVRVGGGQELGLDADIVWNESTVNGGAALAHKRALATGLALVAGAGATAGNQAQTTSAGADVGLIASTRPSADGIQLYGGVRVAAAMPVTGDRYAGGGVSQSAFVPVGLVWRGGRAGACSSRAARSAACPRRTAGSSTGGSTPSITWAATARSRSA
jgi:hypothetical protein